MSAVTGENAGKSPADDGPGPLRRPRARSRADRRSDRIRWSLLVCWLIVGVATVTTGERVSSWDQLRESVAAGEVDAVKVVGGLPAGGTGYSVVGVHWRHGWIGYTAEVVQVRGRTDVSDAATDDATPVVHAPPSSLLAASQPGLRVTQDQERSGRGRLLGWQVPNSVGVVSLLLVFAAFGTLVAGPVPWRATRWAWFWLFTPPIGAVVFLLASGPVPGLPAPPDRHRRLTGGWAFLVSLPLMSDLAPYRW